MKKVLVILLIALSVFAFVSCDHEVSSTGIYTVSFSAGNAVGISSITQSAVGASITLPSTITDISDYEGIIATGWTDGTTVYSLGAEYTPTADVTLTAVGHTWVQLWDDGPKWAEFNVGSAINDYASANGTTDETKYTTANIGEYYKWGATSTTGNGSSSASNIQGTAYDTAKAIWGDNWQMPTKLNFDDLVDGISVSDFEGTYTKWEWCDGTNTQYVAGCTLAGFKVSGLADTVYENNSIFLPAAGYLQADLTSILQGNDCYYWSDTYNEHYHYSYACNLRANNYNAIKTLYDSCVPSVSYYSVRAILAESN